MKKQKVLVIIGPTSSGKSALGVELAKKFNGEIISADSRQVYRGMDIGTGKITKHEMKGVPHHLLDVASPKRTFSAQQFVTLGRRAIQDIASRGKLPIIVGGTGFYVDTLLGKIPLPEAPINKKLRLELEKKTTTQLFTLLKKRDARRAKTIDPHNRRRLVRALEIISSLGSVPKYTENSSMYIPLWVGVQVPFPTLEKKIFARLETRLKQGMMTEAKKLRKNGLSFKRMESFGLEYRALARLLQKQISNEEFKKELFIDIRRYAKRQLTYWKRNKEIRWFSPKDKRLVSYVARWSSGR